MASSLAHVSLDLQAIVSLRAASIPLWTWIFFLYHLSIDAATRCVVDIVIPTSILDLSVSVGVQI